MSDRGYDRLARRIQAVIDAPSDRLDILVQLADLDASSDLRFGNWRDFDLSGADLRGFDFTGADLTGAKFDGALVDGAIFKNAFYDLASLRKAADFRESREPLFKRLALIGTGFAGFSIARAARRHSVVGSIATSRSNATRLRHSELVLVDEVVETNAAAVDGADLVILCIPLGSLSAVIQEIAPHLLEGATVSDAGLVGSAVRNIEGYLPSTVHFVPAHPVVESEQSGVDADHAEIFVDRLCVLSPSANADPQVVERLAAFWHALGARVETMTADRHDLLAAITIHLPHLIASAVVGAADELSEVTRAEVMKYSPGGFRDFSSALLSDPEVLSDALLANKDSVLEILERFNADLSALVRAIRRSDGVALADHFARARAIRRGMVEIG